MVVGQGVEQPRLGFAAHKLVRDLWQALGTSVEGRFFSAADWERARMECWHADKLICGGQPTASQWQAMQHGLSELLISLAVKRRAGIELKPQGVDVDADAAVSILGRYRQNLKPV